MNHKNFCVYPFIQIVSRTHHGIGPCCLVPDISNLQQSSLEQYWNSQALKNIQQQMLHGQDPLNECKICQQHENTFGSSMRTDALRDYNFNLPDVYERELIKRGWHTAKSPNRLEIHVGNTCNLKCLTCHPADSSMFLDEDRRLNISNYNQKDFSYSDNKINEIFDFIDADNLDILDLRGGESMLIPTIKNRLLSLPNKIYDNTTLRIQTNGTIYNDQWKNIFENFKKIEIMVSIDGYGPVNEYVRFPSQWSIIEENIDRFKSHNPKNLYTNTVVSNINLLRLDELLKWSYEKNVYCHLSKLDNPEIYHYTNLPESLLEKAKEKIRQFDHHPGVQKIIDADMPFKQDNWGKFCAMIDTRDQYRKNRVFDIFPEMKFYWKTN